MTTVAEVMTRGVLAMSQSQVRGLPVVDREKHLVGMISLGDIAAQTGHNDVGGSRGDISHPSEPDRLGTSGARSSAGGGSSSGRPSKMPG